MKIMCLLIALKQLDKSILLQVTPRNPTELAKAMTQLHSDQVTNLASQEFSAFSLKNVFEALAVDLRSLLGSCCRIKRQRFWRHLYELEQMRCFCTVQYSFCCCYEQLHLQWSEPVPVAALLAHTITLPPPCFTDEVVCFGSWAVPFGPLLTYIWVKSNPGL